MKFVVLLTVLLATTAAQAKITDVDLKRDTQVLSSDAFEGRKPGTPGGDKAVAYIVQRMQQIGLKPGNHGKWTQDVPLVTITAKPSTAGLTIEGGAAPIALKFVDEEVIWTRHEQPHVALKKSPLVFVGYGVVAPEHNWNDYAGLDMHGKTAVILVNDPDWRSTDLKGDFGGRAMTYYGRWIYKFEEAARQGAAGAIIIHQTEPAAYPFSVVVTSNSVAKQHLATTDKGASRTTIEGWITKPASDRLFAAAGLDFAALEAAAARSGFKAVPMGALTASASLDNTVAYAASQNVVGILPGTSRPKETVLYTAHWDHLGRCPADTTGDDICNGALDNASGVAGLLTLATEAKHDTPTARSQLFIAVTGEESGLLGSQYYAEHPIYPLGLTAGGVNMDVLSVKGRTRDVTITGVGKSEVEPMFTAIAAKQGRVVDPEASPEKGSYYRSDHFSFAKVGVPMVAATSGTDVIGKDPAHDGKAYGKSLAADYVANRYHQPSDQYNPDWDWSGAVQDLEAYYSFNHALANSSAWPNWYPAAEFRAVRDKSRAGL
ncbi:M28 family peptidase [Sphingosinicellaceae bacterium]|nr:M28 family peptidase [Sphingosinicellaceae bacterium]